MGIIKVFGTEIDEDFYRTYVQAKQPDLQAFRDDLQDYSLLQLEQIRTLAETELRRRREQGDKC